MIKAVKKNKPVIFKKNTKKAKRGLDDLFIWCGFYKGIIGKNYFLEKKV